MGTPYLGEIRILSFSFAPKGWAMCNGQLMSIQQNTALFAILGTTYGGNGVQTFGLPDLRGRVPFHFGTSPAGASYTQGQTGGQESHTLIQAEMPVHNHLVRASSATVPDQASPSANLWVTQADNAYNSSAGSFMSPSAIALAGSSQPHENRPPYLVLNVCIALTGIFPSRS